MKKSNLPPAPSNAFCLKFDNLRLGEFDIGGVLYHANYFHLFEMTRENLLREHGVPYPSFVEKSQHLAIVETHQNFIAPVIYGAELEMKLWVTDLRKTSLKFVYQLSAKNKDGLFEVAHSAWTKTAFVQIVDSTLEACRIPQTLREVLEKYLAD